MESKEAMVAAPAAGAGEAKSIRSFRQVSNDLWESEKSKAENKAEKKMSAIMSWENTKKAAVEAKLRTREEKLEKKKAEYAEKMRNQVAAIHRAAEEKRASVEATRREAILKYEDMAAKHRSKGTTPATKFLGCF
ncbi:remorin-like isoform X2 [Miscanthus floridulus]|uniref:remorin-like isoform X2 n=1 Tax=Miscanthus floridulus TaxID=154761 RepID=UPI00345855CB